MLILLRSHLVLYAGLIVKDASISSNGNGGGSPKFAQGGGKNLDAIDDIIKHIEKVIKDYE